jgi:leader peptidase (prepilin peptidase)/N-methyltransferase
VLELLQASPTAFIAVALILGLVIGSFLNVVVYRLPLMLERQWREQSAELLPNAAPAATPAATARTDAATAPPGASDQARPGERPFNLVVPRSYCPACKAQIRALHNIPVLSYLALGGRCANCKVRISPRYPLIELLSGVATALVAWKFGFGWPALCGMVITWFLIALTFIDLDHQLLPDSLTLPLLWLGLLASLSGWTSPAHSLPVTPAGAIAGAAAGYLALWAVYHLFRLATGKEGMGYGDFKLLAALGAWLGWQMLLPIVLFSAAVGAVVGIALIALRRQDRGKPIPFGPFLAAAGWLALMWGPEIVARYLGLFGQRA